MGSVNGSEVQLSGVPGPKAEPGAPFDVDPRVLWRAEQYDSPLDLSEIPTRRKTGFGGNKRAGGKALAERSDLLADLQELLWAHEAAAQIGRASCRDGGE